jgi:hypothetical protein
VHGNIRGGSVDPREKILAFIDSFWKFEFPICDRNNTNWPLFQSLLQVVKTIGDFLAKRWPDNYIATTMRGSYSHGHPYRGNDVDLLFIGRNVSGDTMDEWLAHAGEFLSRGAQGFALCAGRYELGMEIQPIRFLDILDISVIIQKYLYGLQSFLRSIP